MYEITIEPSQLSLFVDKGHDHRFRDIAQFILIAQDVKGNVVGDCAGDPQFLCTAAMVLLRNAFIALEPAAEEVQRYDKNA
jgi:hypothetical protein